MNIFYLDENLEICAQEHCDKHVVKMIVEYTQLLSTAVRLSGIDAGYRITHKNHPCSVWTRESLSNWRKLKKLLIHLHREYQHRYGDHKIHKSFQVAMELPEPNIPDIGVTPLPKCMPDEYKKDSIVESYREFYRKSKSKFAKWTNRQTPLWMSVSSEVN